MGDPITSYQDLIKVIPVSSTRGPSFTVTCGAWILLRYYDRTGEVKKISLDEAPPMMQRAAWLALEMDPDNLEDVRFIS